MNILFILGNGFDLNLGLRTSYQNFYDYYLEQLTDKVAIIKLKEYLEHARYSTWADLEKGLGEYTEKVETVEQMRIIYYDLSDRLREYLKMVESTFSPTEKITKAVARGLSMPNSSLPQGMKDAINSYIGAKQSSRFIDVISFNYTNTLEKVLQPLHNGDSLIRIDSDSFLRSILHIHMRLEDEDVVLGVNDDSQILNKSLVNDDIRGLLVKPYINRQLQNLVDNQCAKLIREADLVYLFGVSIGETDLTWWRKIGARFGQSNIRIVLFTHDDQTIIRNAERIKKYSECKTLLFNRMGITKLDRTQQDRVFVGYKTSLFRA